MRSFAARRAILCSFHEVHRYKPPLSSSPFVSNSKKAIQTTPLKKKQEATAMTTSRKKLYRHTESYLQILGNGTDTGDTMPSVLLFFDSYRYVFNVGEGFQRYCYQHRLKLGKLSDVFLTRMTTEAAGGVPGLFITLSENGIHGAAGSTVFQLHGPVKLDRYLKALSSFVPIPLKGLGCSNFGSEITAGCLGEPIVANEQVEIRPILLIPAANDSVPSTGPFLQAMDWKNIVPAACYVCRLSEIKGKFLPAKARALGVPAGPDFAKLVDGVCVEGSNGRVVHPHEVMEPSMPGPIVLIVDCPDHRYASTLFSAPGFKRFYKRSGQNRELVMVHLGPYEIISNASYQQWMNRFPDDVRHIFVNQKAVNATAIMRKAAIVQAKLNLVDSKYFPYPQITTPFHEEWQHNDVVMGKDLMRYQLKPLGKKGVDTSQLLEPFCRSKVVDELKEDDPEVLERIEHFHELRKRMSDSQSDRRFSPDELEVTFLGTGAAIPSKYRNVSGIYLDFFERGGIMLDCGEGSHGQLIRRFGREGAKQAIRKLRCIWISHVHADHHIGLPTILRERRKLVDEKAPPLLLLGPPFLRSTMENYEELEPLHFKYLCIYETDEALPKPKRARTLSEDSMKLLASMKEALNLKSMESFLVDHCAFAYGIALTGQAGWKVVYSGDTVPCNTVRFHARDATLLIHEATFEEDMKTEARLKKHSTTQDAIQIAKEANAYRTVLTHFSQRYPKVPVVEADVQAGVCIAFDLMSVNLSDLELLPYAMEPCQGLFRAEKGDSEEQEGLQEGECISA